MDASYYFVLYCIESQHARRLFPLQVSPKDTIEWGYWEGSDEDGSWIAGDKTVEIPEKCEKLIGFEGRPDPATGFYCLYDAGRLVDKQDKDKPPK
jgi:hypothetical protein